MVLDAHVVVTDSGLGGLSICAALERRLRESGGPPGVRLTYVNAWPFEGRGYNDLPDVAARAEVFDRALDLMNGMAPDRILIACNTLSILYGHTAFSRRAVVPVQGIVDAGVGLFAEALGAEPAASIVLLGTKTTIESGVHREALRRRGIEPDRIAAVHCHGLAGAIEKDPDSGAVADLIETCAARAREAAPRGSVVFAGLCCTHYGYVSDRIAAALARSLGREIRTLDPNARMVDEIDLRPDVTDASPGLPDVRVEVISKVALGETARRGVARLIEPVSPPTARALLSYSHVPTLF